MEEKKDSLQKLFSELPDAMNLEELMEVKGGDLPPVCGADSTGVSCSGSGGVCVGGGL